MITDEAKRVKAQAYAEYVKAAVERKRNCEERIADQRAQLGLSGVALGEKIVTSPSADAIPDGVADLVDMIRGYCAELRDYVDIVHEFCEITAKLWPQYERVLYLRYVKRLEWDAVAEAMAYNDKYIFDIHRTALIGLYDVMPPRWRE